MKGGDILGNIYHRKMRDLFNRLYKKMGKDYRPKILSKLIKQINKPRTTLRECFDRWRRVIDKEKGNQHIKNIKAKIININVKNLNNRNNRDKLMRAFFHWRAMSKKPEEYYPKINHLINRANIINKLKSQNPEEYNDLDYELYLTPETKKIKRISKILEIKEKIK